MIEIFTAQIHEIIIISPWFLWLKTMPMPGKGKGKRNRGQCLTLISEGNRTRTFILQCEFFLPHAFSTGYVTGIIYQTCTEFCDFFLNMSHMGHSIFLGVICFHLVKVVILESFHTFLPFTASETDIPEHEKQRSIKEHSTVSLLRYQLWCFQITAGVFLCCCCHFSLGRGVVHQF